MAMMPPIVAQIVGNARREYRVRGHSGPALQPAASSDHGTITGTSTTVATGGGRSGVAALHTRLVSIHARGGRSARPQAHGLPETNLRTRCIAALVPMTKRTKSAGIVALVVQSLDLCQQSLIFHGPLPRPTSIGCDTV